MIMLLPAPDSPDMTVNPLWKSSSTCSRIAKFLIFKRKSTYNTPILNQIENTVSDRFLRILITADQQACIISADRSDHFFPFQLIDDCADRLGIAGKRLKHKQIPCKIGRAAGRERIVSAERN